MGILKKPVWRDSVAIMEANCKTWLIPFTCHSSDIAQVRLLVYWISELLWFSTEAQMWVWYRCSLKNIIMNNWDQIWPAKILQKDAKKHQAFCVARQHADWPSVCGTNCCLTSSHYSILPFRFCEVYCHKRSVLFFFSWNK